MKTVKTVSVIGQANCDSDLCQVAEHVGKIVGNLGFALVTGGLTGIMLYASKGAKQAGGTTVGLLPGYAKSEANEFVDIVIPTGLGHARNVIVASSGDFIVSVGGSYGTMSEISIALKLGKDVLSYKSPIEHVFNFSDKDIFYSRLRGALEPT